MDIDTFLDGPGPESETADIEPATPETPEPEVTAAEPTSPPRDEHGRFAPKGETPAAPAAEQQTAPPAVEKEHAPPPGLLEERRKRQEAEQRYEALLQRLGPTQQPTAPQPTEPALIPSIYEDENGFAHGMLGLAEQRAREALMPEFQRMLAAERVGFQERMAAAKYPDYETRSQAFIEMARANPALIAEMKAQADPAEFAYRYAKNAEEVQRLGSLDIDAIKAAAVQDYLAKNPPAQPAPTPPIPTSLADAQSARTSASTVQAPLSLEEILGR